MKIGLVHDWTASVESMYGLDILGDLSEILWSFEVSKAFLLGRYRLETGLSCSSEISKCINYHVVNRHTPVIMNLIKIFAVASLSFRVLEVRASEINDSLPNFDIDDTSNKSNAPFTTSMNTLAPLRIVTHKESLYEDLLNAFSHDIPKNGLEVRIYESEGSNSRERNLEITSTILNRLEQDGVYRVDAISGETKLNHIADTTRLRLFGFISALIVKHNLRNGVRLPSCLAEYLRNPNQSCLELLKEDDPAFLNNLIFVRTIKNPIILQNYSFADYEDPCTRANPYPQTPNEVEEYIELAARSSIQPDSLRSIKEGFELVISSETIAACQITASDFNAALTDYSDYTGAQLRAISVIQNIEGNWHLIEWFFTAIDKLTPHERRLFLYSLTGLIDIPREGIRKLQYPTRIFIDDLFSKFGNLPITRSYLIQNQNQNIIFIYLVESFEKMFEKLKKSLERCFNR